LKIYAVNTIIPESIMKAFSLVLIIAFYSSFLSAQSITNYKITNQDHVDAFNYTTVTGTLSISGSGVTDLSGLSELTNVKYLDIYYTSLTDLNGLQNVTSIQYLTFFSNNSILNIDALSGVSSMNALYINDNNLLSGVNFGSLTGSIPGSTILKMFEVSKNNSLTEISFPGVTSLDRLRIIDNPLLTDISGLSGLTQIGFNSFQTNLSITNNSSLSVFCSFYNLFNGEGLNGFYSITGNAANPTADQIISGGPCIGIFSFTVEELFGMLIERINTLQVNSGLVNSMLRKVSPAFAYYTAGNYKKALSSLHPFMMQVESLYNEGVLTQQEMDELTGYGNDIIAAINNLMLNSGSGTKHLLAQNYPNPFNPVTKIRFFLPDAGNVSVTVYDILGKQIALLLDKELQPGMHECEFNASGIPSGVYFYKITAGNFNEIKKMQVMK
jgi:hypothetical protein